MVRKLGIAGFVAGAAMGAMLMASPANAGEVDQDSDNQQLIPVQLCNTNVAVLGVNSSEAEDCVNGPEQGNIEASDEEDDD